MTRTSDLLNFGLVCKVAHATARSQLYHTVHLDVSKKKHVDSLVRQGGDALGCIRTLQLGMPSTAIDKAEVDRTLAAVTCSLPDDALQKLTISFPLGWLNDKAVLQLYRRQAHLRTIDSRRGWQSLYRLAQSGHASKWTHATLRLHHLHEVMFSRVVLRASSSLKTLELQFAGYSRCLEDGFSRPEEIALLERRPHWPKNMERLWHHAGISNLNISGLQSYNASLWHTFDPSRLRSLTLDRCGQTSRICHQLYEYGGYQTLRSLVIISKLETQEPGLECLKSILDKLLGSFEGLTTFVLDIERSDMRIDPELDAIFHHGATLETLYLHNALFQRSSYFDLACLSLICDGCPNLQQLALDFPTVSWEQTLCLGSGELFDLPGNGVSRKGQIGAGRFAQYFV